MLVRFGTTILNNGWRKDLAVDEEDLARRFLRAKFKNLYLNIDNYTLSGWTHLRLPNLIPKVSIETLGKVLGSGDLDFYKGKLENHRISFSHHNNYICNCVNRNNINYIKNYVKMVDMVMEFMGVDNLQMCNHVNRNDFKDVVDSMLILKQELEEMQYNKVCIENSESGFSLKECLDLSYCTGSSVIFDNLHHRINNKGEDLDKILKTVSETWSSNKTVKIHYSNGDNKGTHNSNLDIEELKNILDIFKKYVKELVVIVELKHSKEIIENLKYKDEFEWNEDLTIEY